MISTFTARQSDWMCDISRNSVMELCTFKINCAKLKITDGKCALDIKKKKIPCRSPLGWNFLFPIDNCPFQGMFVFASDILFTYFELC